MTGGGLDGGTLVFTASPGGGPPPVLCAGGRGDHVLRPSGGPPLLVLRRAAGVLRAASDSAHFAMAGALPGGTLASCPLTGAEMQSPDGGLLNMNPPALRAYRRRLAPLFTRAAADATRPDVLAEARTLAARLDTGADVLAGYVTPLAASAVAAALGLDAGEYAQAEQFAAMAFAPVPSPGAVPHVTQAWADLYAFYTARMHQGLPAAITAALDGFTPAQQVHATGTVANGFGAVQPVLAVALAESGRRWRPLVTACLAGRAPWADLASLALRTRAMFPVLLPRVCVRDTVIGGRILREGEHVLPSLAAAALDPAGAPCDIAFGPGPHLCPGAHLTRVWLAAALEAFWEAHPRARFPGDLDWQPGTLSVPRELPLT